MAFPAVESTSFNNTGASTSHTVTMPADIVEDDLIVIVWCNDGSATASLTGFTKEVELPNGSAMSGAILWKVSDGTEGASVTVTTSAAEPGAYVAYRVSGHNGDLEASINNDDGAGDNTTTTWAVTSVTPSWGADDTLWIIGLESQGHSSPQNDDVSSGYTDMIETTRTSNGALAMVNSGRLESNTTTESPADCITGATTRATTTLVAIQPGNLPAATDTGNALSMSNF